MTVVNISDMSDLCFGSHRALKVIKPRRMRWARHVTRMGDRGGVYRVLVGKPEGKRPFVRPRRRWEDNIKMDLQEMGCERGYGLERAGSGQRQVAGICECGNGHPGSIKGREFLDKLTDGWLASQEGLCSMV